MQLKTDDIKQKGFTAVKFQMTSLVITLQQWIGQGGAEDCRLFEAITSEYPKFTQVSLTNFTRGIKIHQFKITGIISKVTGIPIFRLSFRLTSKYKVAHSGLG